MSIDSKAIGGVTQAVPFLHVSDMERSVCYYVDGLGFTMTKRWIDGGKLRWCWLEKGGAALMLQEFWRKGDRTGRPDGNLGQGVSLVFICQDALAIYRDVTARSIETSEPFVGNAMWVFSLLDPDGYRIEFESPTDTPEETKLSELTP
jgi:catechol 2,3-dioxygenase-like lactoylglutathione lyase family enzyme